MTRHVVLCLDGTNNYPNGGYTNIQRLCRALARDEAQFTYYQPGVGTIEPSSLAFRPGRRLGMFVDSMTALMLQRHVCSAYRYLMDTYREGDVLYAFGFSRGAYAVRVLAGLLTKVGLLHAGFDEMVRFAWETYARPKNTEAANAFKEHYSRPVRVRLLGLFDTVSSIGLPWTPRALPLTFRNPAVEIVRHAQALDERRVMFVQNGWADPRAARTRGTDVQQVWFAGVHSDVGGGYAEGEAQLSRIPLAWMMREAEAAGLRFERSVQQKLLCGETIDVESVSRRFATGPVHDELRRAPWWHALECIPMPRRRRIDGHWRTRWVVNAGKPRTLPAGALLHESVRLRGAHAARWAGHDFVW